MNENEQRFLSGQVIRWSLPAFDQVEGIDLPKVKRLLLPQGELAQIHDGEDPIRYLAVIELVSGGVRGNHYHRAKRETVYLIEGEVRLELEDLARGERATAVLRAGDLVRIPPGIAHALVTVRPGRAIEFAPDPLDPADSHRHRLT